MENDPLKPLVDQITARVKDELKVTINEEQLKNAVANLVDSNSHDNEAIKTNIRLIVADAIKYDYGATLSDNLRTFIKNHTPQQNLPQEQVAQIASDVVKEAIKNFKVPEPKSREIIIKDHRVPEPERKDIVINGEHPAFAAVFQTLVDKLYPYVYGPTGGGKTFGTRKMAELLKVPFYRKVMSSQASESALMGYGQGSGQYVPGIAYKAYKDGGLLLIDEIDNGNANINTVIKQLADGDECYFPVVGVVKKHPDFYLVANANTIGNGATRQYVGRAPQDKAMLNTFVYFEWNYDQDFEERIAWNEFVLWGGSERKVFDNMIQDFWKLRKAIDELQIDHILSTRNLLQLTRETARGRDIATITKSIIVRGLDKDQYRKICERANAAGAIIKSREDIDVFETMEDSLKARKGGGSPF